MSNAKLPHVKSSIPQDLRVFIDRLRDIMGATGANQLVTYNDLVSARLATLNNSGTLTPVSTDTYLATPPTPTGLSASAAIRNIVLSWDNPAYVGHSHAEVWAADSNDLATAVLIGQSPGALYIDNVGPSTTKYYWVRFVNREGTVGPYNSQNGVSGTTGDDVAYTLGLLANQITTSELSSSLNSRIDLIDGPSTTIGTIPYYLAQVQGQIDAINSYPDYDGATTYAANDIVKYDGGLYKATATTTGNLPTDTNYWVKIGDYTSIADAVVTIASDLSQVITELGVEVSDREALALQLRGSYTGTDVGSLTTGLLYNEKTLREYEDGLLATEISSVSATANGKNTIYRQTTAPTSPAVNDIWIDTKISYSETYFDEAYSVPKYKQYQWDGAEWIDITDVEVYDNHAYFISEQTARISADEAIATNITQLESQINGELAVTNARITTEEETRATETGALATRTTTLESSLFDEATGLAATRADIQTNYSTKVDTDSAIASTKTVLRAYADLGSRTFKTDTAPTIRGYDTDTDPATEVPLQEGDIWIDTSVDAELGVVLNKIYVWDGAEWVYTPDGVAAADTASLESTLTTNYYTKTDVDGTIATKETFLRSYANISSKTFYSGSAPTIRGTDPETSDDIPLQTGDVWIKTTDNTRYVWNDDAWQAVSDTKAFDDWVTNTYSPFVSDTNAAIDGKVEFWFDTSDPSTAWTDDTERGKHVGDLWYDDTADAKALKRYTYDAGHDPVYYWVDVVDQTAINAADAAADAQSTADGKITAFYQDNEPTAEGTGDLWFDTNDGNKPYRWTGSAWVSTQDGAIADVDARVTNVETTKIGYATLDATGEAFDNGGTLTTKSDIDAWNADNPSNTATWHVGLPLAYAVKQVAISDGTDSIALEQRFTAQKNINDILAASYTLKIDDNGSVSGIGLFSEGGQSEFITSVDRFAVEAPTTSIDLWEASTAYSVGDIVRKSTNNSVTYVCKTAGTSGTTVPVSVTIGELVADNTVVWQVASRVPFAVQATPSNINGIVVPAGVYIDAAYIVNGTIQTAQIADLAVDDTKIAELNVGKLTAGSLQTDTYIRSSNFVTGESGFNIDADGTAEFQTAVVRGTVYATDGEFTGTVKADTTILGGNAGDYSTGTGFFGGAVGSTYKWRVGDPSGARIQWSGSAVEVYNDSNQLTLSSGGIDLSWDAITGKPTFGDLATADSVSYSSITGTKPPTDADKTSANTAAGIVGQGAFATLEKITPDNISTYIADLAVKTIHIGVDQVTVGDGAYNAATKLMTNTSWTDVISLTITTTGQPVYVVTSGQQTVARVKTDYGTFSRTDSYVLGIFRLLRDGSVIQNSDVLPSAGDYFPATMNLSIRDEPAAGAHTYKLQMQAYDIAAQSGGGVTLSYTTYPGCKYRSIFALEVKR